MAGKNNKSKPKIEIYDPVDDIKQKFDFYIKIVIGVLMVAVVSMLLMVAGVILEAWHFNSAIYREYSEKNDLLLEMRNINKQLLEQNISKYDEFIDLQKQGNDKMDEIINSQKLFNDVEK